MTVSPADADAQAAGHQVSLAEGANPITVGVKSSDGRNRMTYTVTVYRASVDAFGWAVVADFKELAAGNRDPRAIWSDGTTMWIANPGRLFAYDLATMAPDPGKNIASLAGAGNRNANGLWSDGAIVWVSDGADDKIYAYDLGLRRPPARPRHRRLGQCGQRPFQGPVVRRHDHVGRRPRRQQDIRLRPGHRRPPVIP